MNAVNSSNFLWALVVMSPLLIWGIWIVSEESFDELNSRNKLEILKIASLKLRPRTGRSNSKLKAGLSEDANLELGFGVIGSSRELRRKWLPIYFSFLVVLLIGFIGLSLGEQNRIPLLISISLIISSFIYYQKQRNQVAKERISKELEAEMPSQIQLLTILISSGMSPAQAISVLSQRSDSISAEAFREVVNGVDSGLSIVEALDRLKLSHASPALRRFITSLILGIERGSSLSPILTAQVRDARLAHKTEVMGKAGKAEIALMIPVVFLILPISILFALWPSYQQLGAFM